MRMCFLVILAAIATTPASAADLRAYPPEVTISGPNRTQQVIVVLEENGRVTSDGTEKTRFTSSDEQVAKVDATGRVTASGTGEATITATGAGQTVKVSVKVEGAGEGVSFRNHI